MTAHLYRTIQNQSTGKILKGATVTLCEPGADVAITDKLFSDVTLTSELSNPFTSLDGNVDVYLAEGRTVRLVVSYGTFVDAIDNLSIYPPAEQIQLVSTVETSDAILLGWFLANAFRFDNIIRFDSGDISEADVTWPDGVAGHYSGQIWLDQGPGQGRTASYSITRRSANPGDFIYTQPEITYGTGGRVTGTEEIEVAPYFEEMPV